MYTMTNSDGSLFGSSTFFVTEDTTTSLTMNSLITSCIDELNARYAEIRDIPSSHQEAIAWALTNNNDSTILWSENDYAPDLELSITSNNTIELMSVNVDKRGGSIGPWYSEDCVYHDEVVHRYHTYCSWTRRLQQDSVTIPRGIYTALSIVQMIASAFNAIEEYRIFD